MTTDDHATAMCQHESHVMYGLMAACLECGEWLTLDQQSRSERLSFSDTRTWSAQPPSRPGWYWFKGDSDTEPRVVRVELWMDGSLNVTFNGTDHVAPIAGVSGRWVHSALVATR